MSTHTDEQIEEELSKVFNHISMMDIRDGKVFTRYPQLITAVSNNLSETRERVYQVLRASESFNILPGREDIVERAVKISF